MVVKLYNGNVYVADTINETYNFEKGYKVYNVDDSVTHFLAGIDIEDGTGKSISIRSNNICVIDLRDNQRYEEDDNFAGTSCMWKINKSTGATC